jgi:hypothetical protein
MERPPSLDVYCREPNCFAKVRPNLMSKSNAIEIAAIIQRLLPNVHAGTARFWGVWFGRPYDNQHKVGGAEAKDERLIVHFEGQETLQVWEPSGARIDSSQFIITSASRILWQWYWYGKQPLPENLMNYDFVRTGELISVHSTFPFSTEQAPSVAEPAVQFH